MKRFLTTTALIVATTTASFAMDSAQLRDAVSNEIEGYGLNVAIDTLSNEQLSEIYLITTSSDMDGSKKLKIEETLSAMNVQYDAEVHATAPRMIIVQMPDDQLRNAVAASLTSMGIDADLKALDDEQLAEIYLITTSSMNDAEKSGKVEAALN